MKKLKVRNFCFIIRQTLTKQIKLKTIIWNIGILIFLTIPNIAFAGILDPIFDLTKPINDPYKIRDLIISITTFLLGIAGAVATLMIIISGLKYMSSQGNEEKTEGAKKSLTAAVVGLLIVILSYVILNIFVKALGGSVWY